MATLSLEKIQNPAQAQALKTLAKSKPETHIHIQYQKQTKERKVNGIDPRIIIDVLLLLAKRERLASSGQGWQETNKCKDSSRWKK